MSGMALSHRDRSPWGGTVEAWDDGVYVGHLDYAPDGFVEPVAVKAEYRRQGVATSMADYLRSAIGLEPSFYWLAALFVLLTLAAGCVEMAYRAGDEIRELRQDEDDGSWLLDDVDA